MDKPKAMRCRSPESLPLLLHRGIHLSLRAHCSASLSAVGGATGGVGQGPTIAKPSPNSKQVVPFYLHCPLFSLSVSQTHFRRANAIRSLCIREAQVVHECSPLCSALASNWLLAPRSCRSCCKQRRQRSCSSKGSKASVVLRQATRWLRSTCCQLPDPSMQVRREGEHMPGGGGGHPCHSLLHVGQLQPARPHQPSTTRGATVRAFPSQLAKEMH